MDWHGGFTAGVGHALYTARTYPQEYWNRTAFVSEPTGHLTAAFMLEPGRRPTISAHYGWNLRRQRRRVDVADRGRGRPRRPRLGDRLVQLHRAAQPDARRASRPARATPTRPPLRDKTHGRIYRVVYTKAKPETRVHAEGRDAGEAGRDAEAPQHDLAAARPAVAGGAREDGRGAGLAKLIEDKTVDETGLNAGAVHAVWTLAGFGSDICGRQM